jgi:hypothetical protein
MNCSWNLQGIVAGICREVVAGNLQRIVAGNLE